MTSNDEANHLASIGTVQDDGNESSRRSSPDSSDQRPTKKARLSSSSTTSVDHSIARPTVSQIPPVAWGRVMDFLPYADVRRAMATGKLLAVEAPPYVRVLSTFNANELNVRAARRFNQVSEVNIYSLIQLNEWKHFYTPQEDGAEEEVYNYGEWTSYCHETSLRVVPFLTSFSRLKRCFVGGNDQWTRFYLAEEFLHDDGELKFKEDQPGYVIENKLTKRWSSKNDINRLNIHDMYEHDKPEDIKTYDNYEESYKQMLVAFTNAFRTMALPADLELFGVLEPTQKEDARWYECDKDCSLCREICNYFPLATVIALTPRPDADKYIGNCCLSDSDRYDIVRSRPGGREIIKMAVYGTLCKLLFQFSSHRISGHRFSGPFLDDVEDFADRMVIRGARGPKHVCYLPDQVIRRVTALVKGGCPVPSRKEVLDILGKRREKYNLRGKQMLIKSTFDRLVALGLPIGEADFIVVDKTNEPALSSINFG